MVKKLILDCTEELWIKVRLYKIKNGFETSNEAVINLIKTALKMMKKYE